MKTDCLKSSRSLAGSACAEHASQIVIDNLSQILFGVEDEGLVGAEENLRILESQRDEQNQLLAEFNDNEQKEEADIASLEYWGLVDQVNEVKADVECYRRLAEDPRMAEVFSLLSVKAISGGFQWQFIYQAASARFDYAKIRGSQRSAASSLQNVEKHARALAKHLKALTASSVPSINADLTNLGALVGALPGNDVMWPTERKKLTEGASAYSWSVAPSVYVVAEALAESAADCFVGYEGRTGCAVKGRKANEKTDYLRSFCYALRECGFDRLDQLAGVIALVANVALDHGALEGSVSNPDVSADDVRKVLKQL